MDPKPGYKTTVVQQASVRWISEQPQNEQYITNKLFKRKRINIEPMLVKQLQYGDGRTVPTPFSTTYLGVLVDIKGQQTYNLAARLSKCTQQMNNMKQFWNNPGQDNDFKLRKFKTIFHPMLLYGLYHSCLTASNVRVLDSWYVKVSRRVAGIKPAFMNHVSNLRVYDRTSTEPVSHLWFSKT